MVSKGLNTGISDLLFMSSKTKKTPLKERFQAIWLALRWTYQSSKLLTITVILVAIFGGLLAIVEPYLFKLIIDYLVSSDTATEIQVTFALIGVLIAYGVFRVIQGIFWDVNRLLRTAHSLRVERTAMGDLMGNIASLDIAYFEDPKYYDSLTQATQSFVELFWSFTVLITEFVSVFVIVGALLFFDWRIVVLVLLSAAPGVFFSLKWTEHVWSAFSQNSPIYRHAHYYRQLMTDNPAAIKEIRSFGLRPHFLSKFGSLFTNFLKKQDKAAWSQFRFYIIIAFVEGVFAVWAAWFVLLGYLQGTITIGEVTFLWAILFQFAAHLRWIVRLQADINTHATFMTSMVKVLGFKPKVREVPNPKKFPKKIKEGIEFRNVTFYYPRAKKPALKKLNLFIKPHENIALVGENGSGKTTLVKLLCRLYDPDKGEILVDGVNIKEFALEDLYANIGVIFQDFVKYEALVEENIQFGKLRKKGRKHVHGAATKSGAWSFIKAFDKTYKTQVGKRLYDDGVELSGGQWQKVALARAFYRDASILVLDEPTAAVDARAEHELFKRFNRLTQNKIAFLISHRFSTVRMADKIVVIEKGKVVEEGSHRSLLRKNGVDAHLFKLQAEGYK